MAYLRIHHEMINPAAADALFRLCPFSAITYQDGKLAIGADCTMCGLCHRNGPEGAVTLEDDEEKNFHPADERVRAANKDEWRGVAVFAECRSGVVHPVTMELIGKARELAGVTGHPVYALLICGRGNGAVDRLLRSGVDALYVYEDAAFDEFLIEPYANAFSDFIEKAKPSSVLVGATNIGRSLAPRVAARFRTGVTADCTMLEMRENTDLVQIRPAFGGNIMARIITPRHRPQFCTVRYKIFSAREPEKHARASLKRMALPAEKLISSVQILSVEEKPAQIDISDAKIIVAAGRGFKKKEDLSMAEELASVLGAQLACTRPLIECGWFDPRRQIGLSGRTVGADLIITAGISGSVQFAAGMRGCKCIIAINEDPGAPIFNIAHYAAVGDLYEVLPKLIMSCKSGGVKNGI